MSSEQAVTTPTPGLPSRGRGRPRGAVPVIDRAGLIDAAIAAIRAHGPDVTMDDIAAAATVTKPVIYRVVGDKAELTIVLSEWLIDQIDRATLRAHDDVSDPRDRFRAAIVAYFSTIDEHRNLFLFVNASGQPTELLCRLVERSSQHLAEQFTAGRRAVGLDELGARTWAYAIVGALQILAVMRRHDEHCDLDQLADDLTRLMWDGLAASLTPR